LLAFNIKKCLCEVDSIENKQNINRGNLPLCLLSNSALKDTMEDSCLPAGRCAGNFLIDFTGISLARLNGSSASPSERAGKDICYIFNTKTRNA
jgi:hypothetical protein